MTTLNCRDLTLETAIQRHKEETLSSDKFDAFRITVRRGHIFDDSLMALRCGFDDKNHVRVKFIGEPE